MRRSRAAVTKVKRFCTALKLVCSVQREIRDARVTKRRSVVGIGSVLLALTANFACQERPFPNRHVAQLGSGESLEVLEVDMESTYCTLQYVSDIELNRPEAAKRRAHEILLSYLDAHPMQVPCETIVLLPTEWRDDGLWRALEVAAERSADGTWSMQ